MKKQIIINIAVALIVFILMFIFNRKPIIVEYSQQPIIDSLIKDKHKVIRNDSIRYENSIIELNKKLLYLEKKINNERNKFKQEISKFNRPFDSTDFARTNDSIKKVCCPNHSN